MATARILIVEDERISAEDIATRLKYLRYDVSGVVSTGREAIKHVEEIKPDLVLVDIKLKGKMDGIEAADQIRSRFSIPVVYLTAYADGTTIKRLKKTQPFGYIYKPVENNELNGVIETALYKHQMEKRLRESEERFRLFFENGPEYCYMISAEGIILDVNRAALNALGYKKKELIGKSLKTIYAPESRQRMKHLFEKWEKTGRLRNEEIIIITKKGETRTVLLSASSVKDKGGKILHSVSVQRDITERKKVEEELEKLREHLEELVEERTAELTKANAQLQKEIEERKRSEDASRKSETLLRNTIEAIPDLLTVHDRDLRIVLSNWRGHDYVSTEERSGQPYCYQVYMHREKPCKPCHGLEVFKTGKPIHLEKTNPVDGRMREINVYPVLDESGAVAMVAEHIRDITERKRVDEIQLALYNIGNAVHITKDLKELFILIRQYLNKIIDTTNFVIALYDKEKDELSLTYKVDEKDKYTSFTLGRTLTAYVIRTGKSVLATREKIDELTKAGKLKSTRTPSKIWLGVPLKIGKEVVGVMTVQSYEDASRYTETDVEILEFVSQQIAVAIERKRAEDQIQRDLREKEVLLREIHHRVKNNLQVISSLLSLQLRYIKDEEALDMFRESQYRVRSMALVHESLYRSSELARIDFSEYIRNLGNGLYRSYGVDPGKIVLKTRVKDVSLTVDMAVPCGLVINELVSNALKYAFPPSFKKKGKIEITLHPTGKNRVELIVMDNGVGIPDELDFRNTESLGLHLVTILIEDQLHGKITLDRRRGTKFTMKFNK